MSKWFVAAAVLMGMSAGIVLAAFVYGLAAMPGVPICLALCALSVLCSGIGGTR